MVVAFVVFGLAMFFFGAYAAYFYCRNDEQSALFFIAGLCVMLASVVCVEDHIRNEKERAKMEVKSGHAD